MTSFIVLVLENGMSWLSCLVQNVHSCFCGLLGVCVCVCTWHVLVAIVLGYLFLFVHDCGVIMVAWPCPCKIMIDGHKIAYIKNIYVYIYMWACCC